MPVERISKGFKDISMTLQVSPLTYDVLTLTNETAIARAVRNLVLTNPGERFFNPNVGSEISRSLFENIDPISASVIKSQIEDTIKNYEPRVELIEVEVSPNYDNNEFNVTVRYEIVGIDVPIQQLVFALQPTR
ncbi:MAG: GPW/gp25 family protein [Minisyncoccia bacterium]